MEDDQVQYPSREAFREERRARADVRRSDRRRKFVAIPAVIVGLAMVGTGVWVFARDDTDDVPTDVRGTSVERTSTTTSTTTTTLAITDDSMDLTVTTIGDDGTVVGESGSSLTTSTTQP